ncbi:MAG TPA: hypothetical protein VID19_04630 [Candidatus Eremiobacteraceae bacterium]
MADQPFDPVREIVSAGRVLFGNLVLTVPSIIALAIPGLIAIVFGAVAVVGELLSSKAFSEPGAIGSFFTPAFWTGMGIAAILFFALSNLATGAVYEGSARVLAGGAVDIEALVASGLRHAGNVFAFYLIIGVCVILAGAIVVLLGLISYGILGGIALLAFLVAGTYAAFLLIYALPALIIHARGPFDAMRESAALARSNVNSTLILILAWILLLTLSFMVNASFAFIPIFGQIVGLAVHGLCTALMALFSVHFYRLLLGQGAL